jgi:hypothetical protein
MTTAGSDFNSVIAVYRESTFGSPPEAFDDGDVKTDSLDLLNFHLHSAVSRVSFVPEPGATYFISVDGRLPDNPYRPSDSGHIRITVDYSIVDVSLLSVDSVHFHSLVIDLAATLSVRDFLGCNQHPRRFHLVTSPVFNPPVGNQYELGVFPLENTANESQTKVSIRFQETNSYVTAILEQAIGKEWFPVDSELIWWKRDRLIQQVNGGVILLSLPASLAQFRPPQITAMKIEGPAHLASGAGATFLTTVDLDDNSKGVITDATWRSSLFPITVDGTNATYLAGFVQKSTVDEITAEFVWNGVTNTARFELQIEPDPPIQLSEAGLTKGKPSFQFQIGYGAVCTVQRSFDLNAWEDLRSFEEPGEALFSDTQNVSQNKAFYRVSRKPFQ